MRPLLAKVRRSGQLLPDAFLCFYRMVRAIPANASFWYWVEEDFITLIVRSGIAAAIEIKSALVSRGEIGQAFNWVPPVPFGWWASDAHSSTYDSMVEPTHSGCGRTIGCRPWWKQRLRIDWRCHKSRTKMDLLEQAANIHQSRAT